MDRRIYGYLRASTDEQDVSKAKAEPKIRHGSNPVNTFAFVSEPNLITLTLELCGVQRVSH